MTVGEIREVSQPSARTRSGGRDRLPYDNVEQSGVVQVGA